MWIFFFIIYWFRDKIRNLEGYIFEKYFTTENLWDWWKVSRNNGDMMGRCIGDDLISKQYGWLPFAWRSIGSLAIHRAPSKEYDQTGWMPRLIILCWMHRSFCWFCHVQAHIIRSFKSMYLTYYLPLNLGLFGCKLKKNNTTHLKSILVHILRNWWLTSTFHHGYLTNP